MSFNFFATCPKGLEGLLHTELLGLGFDNVRETVAGVACSGDFELGMRACLWSRFASRFLLKMSEFLCENDTELYMGANGVAWEKWFNSDNTIAVDFTGTNDEIRNTQYGALKVKDALCDRLQKAFGKRPYVDKENPDIRIYCHLERRGEASIYIDMSGKTLHKREFHRMTGTAPLKENLAAAMVERSGYTSGCFCDPMCGSGTLLLEAAAKITDTAPGIKRSFYGFYALKCFDKAKWQAILDEAHERHSQGLLKAKEHEIELVGFDLDEVVVKFANENAQKAGFGEIIKVYTSPLAELKNPFAKDKEITVVTNPPYGKRLGNFNELISLYTLLGERLKQQFKGAKVAIISSEVELLSCLRLHSDKVYKLYNGELNCQLRVYEIKNSEDGETNQSIEKIIAPDFTNRLKKNLAKITKWASKHDLDCYRVYDADIPEYAAAIDYYNGYYVIAAYKAPKSVNPIVAQRHVLDMIAATVQVTGVEGSKVILKSREIKKGSDQYEKSEELTNNFLYVHENDLTLKVNLEDYLDTGLFLDSRNIRALIKSEAKDKDFLNLFAYTCTASIAAASGGASSTLSVDMSRTYLQWGQDNLRLNNLSSKNNDFIQADCLFYLSQDQDRKFDLIYIDPPTFSNSKRMSVSFDIKRDHVALLSNLTRHLKDEGTVIFCTNCRDFKLDEEAVADYGFEIENISDKTIPEDFARNRRIHTCFKLEYKRENQKLEPKAMVETKFAPKWQKVIGSSPYGALQRKERSFEKSFDFNDDFKAKRQGFGGKKSGFKDNFGNSSYKRFDKKVSSNKPKARVWGPDGVKDL
ncbi:MAG: bifunctional 23S rRNA (guanine(2069)-N(7))-methyltransferase RlmK/23S rRNA (guanine(2445)-N(2))-methyltransferase RlmL [Succinatimonas sp.]|nr:bifunctional 23S rRNA (guanine(2069)-N(7))-methyltransferase RlmK/23S rRNA (guanine(2445)-N(2))-methyltransferase RlmL [Succinatimonas sp.]